MIDRRLTICSLLLACACCAGASDLGALGAFAKWQKIEIALVGPDSSATATPNPFNLLVDVVFTRPDATTIMVPGFYNGDNAGGESGNRWVVRFGADQLGDWSFTSVSATPQLDGYTGTFTVTAVPADAVGLYRWGRLSHPGTADNRIRYLKFRDGPYWVKGGCDSPESFLSLTAGWRWNTNAKRMAGIDYLATIGINSMYIMTLNSTGDSPEGVWPFLGDTSDEVKANSGSNSLLDDPVVRFSIPRLDEWLTVFEHMQGKGMVVYIVGEDDDTAGPANRLRYYRELVARYGWMPGVMFNTREEGGSTWEQLAKWTQVDPYGIPAAGHNINSPANAYIDSPHTDMTSIQTSTTTGGLGHNQLAINWINACTARGQRVLMVSFDEPRGGTIPRQKWWAGYLGGAGGYEEIFVPIDKGDQDFSYYEDSWRELAGARHFMDSVAFWRMNPRNDLVLAGNAFCLSEVGEQYAVYLIDGVSCDLDLAAGRTYRVQWWNPEQGADGSFIDGGVIGGGRMTLTPPAGGSTFGDWGLRIVRDSGGGNVPPSASDAGATVLPGDSVDLTLAWTDPDGPGPYTVTVVDAPTQGTLTGTGAIRSYTANSDAMPGTDSFTWRVNDGAVDSNLATMTITIEDGTNDAPVADDASATTAIDTPVEVPLLWNDPDGPGPYTITIVVPPQHGTVAAVTAGGNEYRYTPDSGYTGLDSFGWRVNDGDRDSSQALVSLVIVDGGAGLVAYWPLDDGAGSTTATDLSGNDNDGTLQLIDVVSAWVPGRIGGALSFAGGGDRFELPDFTPPPAGSIACWMKPGAGSGNRLIGGSDAFEILFADGKVSNQLFAAGSTVLGGSRVIPIDEWHHVVCTWNYTTHALQIYVDGVLDVSGNQGDDDPGMMTLSVGTRTGQTSSFVGTLDDVRIYGRVLSADEIAALAAQTGGAVRTITMDPLPGFFWRCDGMEQGGDDTGMATIFTGLGGWLDHILVPIPAESG